MQAPGRPPEALQCKLNRELWSGPLGSVWLASVSRGSLAGQAALVRRVMGLDDRASRVQQAAEVARLLSHRSLLKVLGTERSTDGGLSIISQHLECISLRALARGASERGALLPVPVAVRIVADALQAASALHKQLGGIRFERTGYDRSLFADTIVISSAGETRLMDPGVSEQLASQLLARGERELLVYRAPEELSSAVPASERAEVWTTGLLLWELLAGRRVSESSRSDDAVAALRAGRVPPLEQGRPGISPSLSRVIERAMSPSPERRPATLAEFARALQAFGPNVVASPEAVKSAVAPFLDHGPQVEVESSEISEIVDARTASSLRTSAPTSAPQDWEPPTLVRDTSQASILPPPPLPPPPPPRQALPTAPLEPLPRFPETGAEGTALPPRLPVVRRQRALLIGVGAAALALVVWLIFRGGSPAESVTESPPPARTTAKLPAAAATPEASIPTPVEAAPKAEPLETPETEPSSSAVPPAKPPAQGPEVFHPRGI